MCFCFDGKEAVAAFRPQTCRERSAEVDLFAPLPTARRAGPAILLLPPFRDISHAQSAARVKPARISTTRIMEAR